MAKRSAFKGGNKSKSGGGGGSSSSSSTKTGGVLGGSSTATASTQSGTRTKTATQQSGGGTPVVPVAPATPKSPYTGTGASNLSQYYSGKGSQLGGSVSARFSDPEFASAAQRAGITQQQYQINPGNARYNQSILAQLKAGGTQANPLVETVQNNTTTTPTVGEALQSAESTQPQYTDISYQFGADPNAEVMGYYKSLADQRIDEDKIRRDVLNQFQGRIQATNQVYDQLLSQARKTGQGEVGAGTALLAARGLAGSARGMAIAGGIEQQNLEREQGVEAQRLQQIAEIQNQAYALAQDAIAEKQNAKNQGYAAYVDFLSKDQERKAKLKDNFVASLIYSGKDINNLNPKQLSDIAKQLGSSADEIRTTYDILKAQQEAQNAEEQAFTLSEGQARYVLDPETGEYTQVAQRGKTYKGGSGGGSGAGIGGLGISSETGFSDKQLKQIDADDDVKKLKAVKDLENKLNAYNDIVQRADGFKLVGADKALADSLYSDLKIAYKEAANLGALTGPDVGIITGAIKPISGGIAENVGYKTSGGLKGIQNSIQAAQSTLATKRATYSEPVMIKYGSTDPYIQNITGSYQPTVNEPITSNNFSARLPNGKTIKFNSQKELEAFKRETGL